MSILLHNPVIITYLGVVVITLLFIGYKIWDTKRWARPDTIRAIIITPARRPTVRRVTQVEGRFTVGGNTYNVNDKLCLESQVGLFNLVTVATCYYRARDCNPIDMLAEIPSGKERIYTARELNGALETHVAQDAIRAFMGNNLDAMQQLVIILAVIALGVGATYWLVHKDVNKVNDGIAAIQLMIPTPDPTPPIPLPGQFFGR